MPHKVLILAIRLPDQLVAHVLKPLSGVVQAISHRANAWLWVADDTLATYKRLLYLMGPAALKRMHPDLDINTLLDEEVLDDDQVAAKLKEAELEAARAAGFDVNEDGRITAEQATADTITAEHVTEGAITAEGLPPSAKREQG